MNGRLYGLSLTLISPNPTRLSKLANGLTFTPDASPLSAPSIRLRSISPAQMRQLIGRKAGLPSTRPTQMMSTDKMVSRMMSNGREGLLALVVVEVLDGGDEEESAREAF